MFIMIPRSVLNFHQEFKTQWKHRYKCYSCLCDFTQKVTHAKKRSNPIKTLSKCQVRGAKTLQSAKKLPKPLVKPCQNSAMSIAWTSLPKTV